MERVMGEFGENSLAETPFIKPFCTMALTA
jgi:hypothetical protein